MGAPLARTRASSCTSLMTQHVTSGSRNWVARGNRHAQGKPPLMRPQQKPSPLPDPPSWSSSTSQFPILTDCRLRQHPCTVWSVSILLSSDYDIPLSQSYLNASSRLAAYCWENCSARQSPVKAVSNTSSQCRNVGRSTRQHSKNTIGSTGHSTGSPWQQSEVEGADGTVVWDHTALVAQYFSKVLFASSAFTRLPS